MNVDPPPSNSAGDYIHTAARMAISALPYVGGPGLEFFNSVIAPPCQRRQREWMDRVAESIRTLEATGRVSLADLQKDDGFVDVVLQASQAAVRTSEDEKRQALLNAVLNSALPHSPANSKREVFIAWLDSLTVCEPMVRGIPYIATAGLKRGIVVWARIECANTQKTPTYSRQIANFY